MTRFRSAVWVSLPLLFAPIAAKADSVRQIAETYARSVVQTGDAIGVGVAVIDGHKPARFFTYGDAMVKSGGTPARPFASDTLFEIGSVTKVFTTNLLGQGVVRGELELDTRLSSYTTQIGSLKRKMAKVKLKELADFTGGIADYAPLCSTPKPPPGCLPSGRPTLKQYGGADFATYFANAKPMNYSVDPPAATKLPAPYFYSDFGVGLLGLLLAQNDDPLSNSDVKDWFTQVKTRILKPLDMPDTYLNVPASQSDRLAGGYNQALAIAEITDGAISGVTFQSRGGSYSSAPRVRIVGGGGKGARAKAKIDNGEVESITIKKGGSGYIAPPTVVFANGGSTTQASAHAIIRKGKMIGIAVTAGGAGYKQVPDVVITGGRSGGTDATATAYLVNGKVSYVSVDSPGSGYVKPLSVLVAPGDPIGNTIPVWAAAGALTTSLKDMASFAQAALIRQAGHVVSEGFEIAVRPYACTGPNPALATCPATSNRSGLAWAVQPKDAAADVPVIVSKDGSLGGFTTYVALMPHKKLGVVVFANSREMLANGFTAVAPHVANNILYGLFYRK